MMNLPGFCAAPWVEGVLYHDGLLRTCCRNNTTFANWQQVGLEQGWHSKPFQQFRAQIHAGNMPDESCMRCYQNGTARSLSSELSAPFQTYRDLLETRVEASQLAVIDTLPALFSLRTAAEDTQTTLTKCQQALEQALSTADSETARALQKIEHIRQVAQSFLFGELRPPIVAPFRQVQLIAKCNARCVHCPGLFSGEIIRGTAMQAHHTETAFAHAEHIFDFFMNGSEFLVFKGWQTVAQRLAKSGVQLTISTNGIRLNREAIRFLIDNRIVRTLNISLDGATKAMIESIRVNVNYEELVDNLHYLIRYANERHYNFNLAFSFVLMKRNYHEFPRLVEWVHDLQGTATLPHMSIYCQALESFLSVPGYVDFLHQEHHALIEPATLQAVFMETLRLSEKTHIPVSCFYSYKLADFVAAGYPFPPAAFNLQTLEPSKTTADTAYFSISPHLSVQSALSPGANRFCLANENKLGITLDLKAILTVNQSDVGQKSYLFAVIVQGEQLWVAQASGWRAHQADLPAVIAQGGVTAYREVEGLAAEHTFILGEHALQVAELDVYFGYAPTAQLTPDNLANYCGAAYRVTQIT